MGLKCDRVWPEETRVWDASSPSVAIFLNNGQSQVLEDRPGSCPVLSEPITGELTWPPNRKGKGLSCTLRSDRIHFLSGFHIIFLYHTLYNKRPNVLPCRCIQIFDIISRASVVCQLTLVGGIVYERTAFIRRSRYGNIPRISPSLVTLRALLPSGQARKSNLRS